MSGKRQHYVPLFLQKGFASHTSGEEVFTWVYRNRSEPINPNIKNVGTEGYFYTQADDNAVDDLITSFEGEQGLLISELRTTEGAIQNNLDNIAQLIAQLEVRTRHFRQSLLEGGKYLITHILEIIRSEETFNNYLARKVSSDPSLIRKALMKELRARGVPKTQAIHLLRNMNRELLALIPQATKLLRDAIDGTLSDLERTLSDAAKEGHLHALQTNLMSEAKVARLRELKYQVKIISGAGIPLGDSAVLFHVKGTRPCKPILDKDDELISVILPLAPHRVLIGGVGGNAIIPCDLSSEISKSSLEYFIASEKSDRYVDQKNNIGEEAHVLSHQEIDKIIENCFNE